MNNGFIRSTAIVISAATAISISGLTLFTVCNGKATVAPVITYQLTVLAGAGGTITTPSSSTVSMSNNSAIAIKASPDAGYTFLKWIVSTECARIAYKNAASTTVRLASGNDTVRAVFIPAASGLKPVDLAALGRLEAGVTYNYYTGAWTSLPDFSALVPDETDSCGAIDVASVPHRSTNFGIVFSGYLDIPFEDDYTFYAKSSDGSLLLLNDSVIIDNDGIHASPTEENATVSLATGKYLITVRYFDATSSPACTISYACPAIGIEKQVIANGVLSRPYTGLVSKIIIIKPAGGETYYIGDSLHVRWIYRHVDHMVFCEISTDDGKSYSLLDVKAYSHTDSTGYTDTIGHKDWKIPMNDSMITNQARIRVRDYPPGSNSCVSNAFSIDSAAF
jgi:hypothetical protein